MVSHPCYLPVTGCAAGVGSHIFCQTAAVGLGRYAECGGLPMSKSTLTPFLNGAVRIHQPVDGYRFSIDSVLLAGFARARTGERVLDLGTGCGVILLIMAHHYHLGSFTGIEIQEELAALASRGFEENGWNESGVVICGDFRTPGSFEEGSYDLVVCNPPYFEAARGKISSNRGRAFARQGLTAELSDVMAAAERAMAPGGRLCLIWPWNRRKEVSKAASANGLRVFLSRAVLPSPDAEPRVGLIQCVREARKNLELSPLIVRNKDGSYTGEVEGWLGDRIIDGPGFFCDAMLGKLATYLRLLGFDCAFNAGSDREWLLQEAARSGRTLLSRDGELLRAAGKLEVKGFDPGDDDPVRQLAAVAREVPVEADTHKPPRCTRCNAPLLSMKRDAVKGAVPPYTFLTHRAFSACQCCGRITWEGSHLSRFREKILSGITEEKI